MTLERRFRGFPGNVLVLAAVAPGMAACDGPGASTPMAAPEVSVARPLVRPITDWDEYTGRLEAVDAVEIRARVTGYLQSRHFDEGALVEKGDLLFVIDPRPYEAVLDQAKAELARAQIRLDLARNDFDRAIRLFDSRAISEEELDARSKNQQEAAAALTAARAAVRSAELDVEFTRVHAPVAGRIGRELTSEGNLVSGGSPQSTLLTTIVSLDPIHVYFTADERAFLRYQRLDQGGERQSSRTAENPVRMQLSDEEGFPHVGHMDFVDNRVDQATGTMQGRAVFPNPDYFLTPGLFARLQLLGRGPYDALLIPDAAIAADQAQRFVFVVDESGKAERRPIDLGPRIGELRVVASGLDANDVVIVNGLQRVRSGVPINGSEVTIAEPVFPVSGELGDAR
jgi:RND family efflux transporter MFP subunit